MESLQIKAPRVTADIHPLIRKRWSALAFADQAIPDEQVRELFEAASWAPSAHNDQPWEYIYAHRATAGFERLLPFLYESNQVWAKSASILFVATTRSTYSKNGKPNPSAVHDLGMANAQLLLQAVHRGIYGHLIAGFDADKVRASFQLQDSVIPVCMGALGYLGNAEDLDDHYRTRELSARTRKPVSEFVKKI